MSKIVPKRISVATNYRYPVRWGKWIIVNLFRSSIREGKLALQFEDEIIEIGSGDLVCTIAPPTLLRFVWLLFKPDFRIASQYTKGYWCCEKEKLYDFLKLLTCQSKSPLHAWFRLFSKNYIRDKFIYKLFPLKVKHRIASHYNTSPDFMRLILGSNLIYTCAFFDNNHTSLSLAQENKIDHIIQRLGINRDSRVLDFGCGWGQLAKTIADKTQARVTGVSIAKEQIAYADQTKSTLTEYICSDFETYNSDLLYDRIYSVGMLEHVGRGRIQNLFKSIERLLAVEGKVLIHSIVKVKNVSTNDWIDQEIFPGAYIPTLSEVVRAIEASSLEIETKYSHEKSNYLNTLTSWANNFYRNYDKLSKVIKDIQLQGDIEQILKIWEFYLSGSRLSFNMTTGNCYNVQIVLRPKNSCSNNA